MDRFVATCDPSKGGIHISQTTANFPEDCRSLIERNCLELVLSEDKKPWSIFPVGDGRFVVTTARRVSGSKTESRPHIIVQGCVVDGEHLLDVDFGDSLFEPKENQIQLKAYEMSALSNILTEVIRLGKHIQLLVPDGMERTVQALCYDVLPMEMKNRLYSISNGDCAMSDATLLISKEILGRNPPKYIPMTWETFLKQGRRVGVPQKEEAKKTSVEEAVETCVEYISDPYIPENKIYMIRKWMMKEDEDVFEEFQMKLRAGIETLEISEKEFSDYVQIMCMAFEKYKGMTKDYTKPMLTIPYDMEGLMDFVRNRCQSKRERCKYMDQILELQLECYNSFLTDGQKQKIKQRCKRR